MTMEAAMLEERTSSAPAPLPRTQAAPAVPLRRPQPWLIPGMISGALLWTSFFPLSWGAVAWFALVPLLMLVRMPVSLGRVFWGSYLGGMLFFLSVLQWMRVADDRMYVTWLMLACYCAVYFPAGVLLVRYLDRRTPLPLVLSVPLAWTSLEFVRSVLLTGFAWYFLGYSQHANLPLIQIADLAGVYGISFLIAAVNGYLADWCCWLAPRLGIVLSPATPTRSANKPRAMMLVCQGVGLATVLVGALIYGNWQLARSEFETGPMLALLQGNVDQRIRNQADQDGKGEHARGILNGYKDLSDRAYWRRSPDLIIWPETSFPYGWNVLPEDLSKIDPDEVKSFIYENQMMQQLPPADAVEPRAMHLIGLSSHVFDATGHFKKYNSAILCDPSRADVTQDRYDKIHRVPFGEYVPLRDWLPFMNAFSPYDHDYSVHIGEKLTRFVLGKYRFGVLICNEDADPVLGRAYACDDSDGPAVDFIVNITNDGWFTDTCEHEQHLALCRFRAIECRRAVARAVNTGISAIIDSNGRVLRPKSLPLFEPVGCKFWEIEPAAGQAAAALSEADWPDYKNVEGVLRGNVPIDRRPSLYVRCGDWLPWSCCWVVALGLVWGQRTWRQVS